MESINLFIPSFQKLSILIAFSALSSLAHVDAAKAQPQRRAPLTTGNTITNTNVQVDTTGRDSTQRYSSDNRGADVTTDVSVQLNMSGCQGQNSSQTVDQNRTGPGSNASASVSVCNPANKLRQNN